MTDINVDDFCKDAARALLVLYRAFPRPLTLFVEDLCGRDEPDEFGMHSTRHMACLGALLWLAEEGWIRYADTLRQEAVEQAVLTGRAFTLLSTPLAEFAPPNADSLPESRRLEEQTRVRRLERVVSDGSSTRTRAAVLELLNAFTG